MTGDQIRRIRPRHVPASKPIKREGYICPSRSAGDRRRPRSPRRGARDLTHDDPLVTGTTPLRGHAATARRRPAPPARRSRELSHLGDDDVMPDQRRGTTTTCDSPMQESKTIAEVAVVGRERGRRPFTRYEPAVRELGIEAAQLKSSPGVMVREVFRGTDDDAS